MTTAYRLVVDVELPAGVYVGESRGRNRLELARDGMGRVVLRGTALAGALRHAYAWSLGVAPGEAGVQRWFGRSYGSEDEGGGPSPLRVHDAILDFGKGKEVARPHIGRDRHTGAALDGSFFSIAATPPGTRAQLVFWLHDDSSEAREFLGSIVTILDGLTVGGSAARGLGTVKVTDARVRAFDLSSLDQHANYLDARRASRESGPIVDGERVSRGASKQVLRVAFELGVPRGQDLLIGDGAALDHDMEPQRAVDHGGVERWRVPGSSLRGAFRAWVARLAAREGRPVSDSHERHIARRARQQVLAGDDVAHGLIDDEARREQLRRNPGAIDCPVLRLFGSAYAKGRLHVSDGFAQAPPREKEPMRRHVAVDRITGGAQDGLLFDNTVIPAGARFAFTITVRDPEADEVRWLATTLRAIDMGILRIGSSKAAGRLALTAVPVATGPFAEVFTQLAPVEG